MANRRNEPGRPERSGAGRSVGTPDRLNLFHVGPGGPGGEQLRLAQAWRIRRGSASCRSGRSGTVTWSLGNCRLH